MSRPVRLLRHRPLLPPPYHEGHQVFERMRHRPTAQTANMKPTVNPRPDKMNKRITPSLSCQKLLVSEGADSLGDVEPGVSHCLESGLPHRLTLPSKELLLNDPNWLPCSILPVKLFYERFNQAREVREANSGGISPESLFQERSNDSIWVRVLSCDGMCPVKALCDRLSPRSETSFPNDFGIGPPIELFERSIALKIVKILVNVRVFPLYVIVAIS